MRANNIVQVVGIPGVGKDYMLDRYKKEFGENYSFVNFGEEIFKIVNEVTGTAISRDNIKDINEELLRQSTASLLARIIQSPCPTILNTHMVLKQNGEFLRDFDAERTLKSSAYIHIIAEPKDIFARRAADIGRKRAVETIEEIIEHQNISLSMARNTAKTLGAGFYYILNSDRLFKAKLGLMHRIFTNYLRG